MNLGNGAAGGRFDALDRSHSVTEFNVINSLSGPTLGSSFKTLPATLPERVKQKSGFGRVPLDIAPISDDHRCYRQSRLRAGRFGEAAQGQCSAQTIPGILHPGSWIMHHGSEARAVVSVGQLRKHRERLPVIALDGSSGRGLGLVFLKWFAFNPLDATVRPSKDIYQSIPAVAEGGVLGWILRGWAGSLVSGSYGCTRS